MTKRFNQFALAAAAMLTFQIMTGCGDAADGQSDATSLPSDVTTKMAAAPFITVTERVGDTEAKARSAPPSSILEFISPNRLAMRQLINDRMVVSSVYFDDKHYFAKPPAFESFTVSPALTVEARLQVLAEVTNWGQGNAVTSDGLTRVLNGDTYRISLDGTLVREIVVETASTGAEHVRVSTYTYSPVTVQPPSVPTTISQSCDDVLKTGSICFETVKPK